jgi:RNA polymerase sigma-70 factor (ECF subfamily)
VTPVSDPSLHTTQLQLWTQRIRQGDRDALDELVRAAVSRLEPLARKMLRGFPGVRHYEETGDVLQGALMRLLRALQEVDPPSMRDFVGLAAEQLRRELLDLSRHYYGPRGQGTHQVGAVPLEGVPAPEASDEGPAELERWCAFHEGVARLPAEEREVVGLIFYHGWSQKQVAEVLQVTDRTVRRWWESALVRLRQAYREEPAT